MSDLALFSNNELPAYLKNAALDDVTSALAGESLGSRRISIKGGVFREMIGGKEYRVSEERSMNVVIVKAAPKVSRIYYAGSYSEGETVSPTCWSSDSQRPDEKVKDKQAPTCLVCAKNIKGSGQGDSCAIAAGADFYISSDIKYLEFFYANRKASNLPPTCWLLFYGQISLTLPSSKVR